MRTYVIASDKTDVDVLSLALQRAGFAALRASDTETVAAEWSDRPADLIVISLHGSDYAGIVGKLRSITVVPIILITESMPEQDQAQLYAAGADLLLFRPYSIRILTAQALALYRISSGVPFTALSTLSLGGMTLDPVTRQVRLGRRPPVRLTNLEFRLLYALMQHKDQALSSEQIIERVWGYTGEGDASLVRGLVSRLRNKIEPDPADPRYVITAPGHGYGLRLAVD